MGWCAIRSSRIRGDLARDADLLLVAARQRRRRAARRRGCARRTPRAARSRAGACCGSRESRASRAARERYSRSARFSASVKSSTSPRSWRSSAMWATPASVVAAHAAPRHVLTRHADVARLGSAQAGYRLDELLLAVAVDAGERDDLARRAPPWRGRAPPPARGRRARAGPRPRARARRASPLACRPAAARRVRPSGARGSASVAPSVETVSIFLPRRRTVTRSAISSTSLSLWLMKTIATPSAWSAFSTLNRSAPPVR